MTSPTPDNQNGICYEYPLNERIRLFMRYEQLMRRFQAGARDLTVWGTQSALQALLEIYELNARIDIKSDVIREIERILSGLDKLETVKTVDQERLHSITEKLRQEMSSTHAINGPLGAHLKDHEFFNVLRQRGSVPGGINSFDLPQYHHWLCYPAEVRQTHLLAWIMPYEKINRSIGVILTLIRESSEKRPHLAQQGFYQHMLDPRHPHLMLRIWLTKSSALYPEVSSGKHRFNIRFLEIQDMATRPQQTGIDVNFELMCCTL